MGAAPNAGLAIMLAMKMFGVKIGHAKNLAAIPPKAKIRRHRSHANSLVYEKFISGERGSVCSSQAFRMVEVCP
jgi:hypothetical protein